MPERPPKKKNNRTSSHRLRGHSLTSATSISSSSTDSVPELCKEVLPYSRFRTPRSKLTHAHSRAPHVSCAFDFGTSRGIFWLLLRFLLCPTVGRSALAEVPWSSALFKSVCITRSGRAQGAHFHTIARSVQYWAHRCADWIGFR